MEDYFDSEAEEAEYQNYLDGLRYEEFTFGPRPEIELPVDEEIGR